MKLLLFLLCASSAFAQAPVSSLSLYVKEVSSKATTVTKWDYGDGWYNRDVVRKKGLEIEIRNMNGLPANPVEWAVYFFASKSNSRELFIYGEQKGKVSVGPGQSQKVNVSSKELIENDRNYGYYGPHCSSGSKSRGYVVVVSYAGSTLNPYISNSTLGRPEELLAIVNQHASEK